MTKGSVHNAIVMMPNKAVPQSISIFMIFEIYKVLVVLRSVTKPGEYRSIVGYDNDCLKMDYQK